MTDVILSEAGVATRDAMQKRAITITCHIFESS
jgi:hypothetical protein